MKIPLAEDIAQKLGSRDVYSGLSAHVCELLRELNIEGAPTPVERIAEHLGVTSVQEAAIPCDGMLLPLDSGAYRVMLSTATSPQRRRFSLAHELGHIIIHRLVPETRRFATRSLFMPPGHVAEESLCNFIAAELLMPKAEFTRNAVASASGSLTALFRLASLFDVSLTACAARFRELSRMDFALFKVRVFPSEEMAILDRVLLRSRKCRKQPQFGDVLQNQSVFMRAAVATSSVFGFEWIRMGNERRRWFVECKALSDKGYCRTALAVAGPKRLVLDA